MKKNKIKEQIEAEKDLLKAYLQTAENEVSLPKMLSNKSISFLRKFLN